MRIRDRLRLAATSWYRSQILCLEEARRQSWLGSRSEIDFSESFKRRIIPDHIYKHRKHADIRIARRATTIASLARVISERTVSDGLRRTLLTQARRLERLASQRVDELGITSDLKK